MLRVGGATVLLLATALAQDAKPAAEPVVTLEGRVVDLRGEPVPAAKLRVTTDRAPTATLARGVADGDGYFKLARVPKRSAWKVEAEAPGLSRGDGRTAGDPKPMVVTLHDAASVRGVVRNRAGETVAGAVVRAQLVARILPFVKADATTDADGKFELTGVPLGPIRVAAIVPGEGLAEASLHVGGDCADVTVTPTQAKTTTLAVVIDGVPAKALTEAQVFVVPYVSGRVMLFPPPWYAARFQADGSCSLSPVPDCDYTVRADVPGYALSPNEIRVKAGEGPHRFEFRAEQRETVALQCRTRVVDDDGKPVPGVALAMREYNGTSSTQATTGPDGVATIASPCAKGTNFVIQSLDARFVLDQDIDPARALFARALATHVGTFDPEQTVELRVEAASRVAGRVTLADGRAGAFVSVGLAEENPNRTPRWMYLTSTTTDRDGAFELPGLHHVAANLRVEVQDVAGAATSEAFQLATAGTEVQVPPLVLQPPAIVEGVVRAKDQRPAPGIRVWLREWDLATASKRSLRIVEVITDRQGRYRFLGVSPGGVFLQVLAPTDQGSPTTRAVEPFAVAAGKTYTHDLQVPAK